MPDLGQFITTAAALFSLLTGAGLAAQRGLVIGLRERVNDQDGRIKDLKDERAEDQAEIVRQQAVILGLEEKLHTLSSVVTGEVYWKAIEEIVAHHMKSDEDRYREFKPMLQEIVAFVRRQP